MGLMGELFRAKLEEWSNGQGPPPSAGKPETL
jgi:hypothetical protein